MARRKKHRKTRKASYRNLKAKKKIHKSQNIRAVIFDIGGVLINCDVAKTVKAFQNLMRKSDNVVELTDEAVKSILDGKSSEEIRRFETGVNNAGAFRAYIRTKMGLGVGDDEIDQAWNAMLGDIPVYTKRLIEVLEDKNIPVCALSNTNEIHVEKFDAICKGQWNCKLSSLMPALYSNEINKRKPDQPAFLSAVKELGFKKNDCLFIDDSQDNIDAATGAGLKAVRLDSIDQLPSLLKDEGVLNTNEVKILRNYKPQKRGLQLKKLIRLRRQQMRNYRATGVVRRKNSAGKGYRHYSFWGQQKGGKYGESGTTKRLANIINQPAKNSYDRATL